MPRTHHAPRPIVMPTAGTVVGAVERGARAGMREAGDLVVGQVASRAPRRTGSAGDGVSARVAQTSVGIRLVVQPNTKLHPTSRRTRSARNLTNRVVWRWIERGTGLRGPNKRLIRRRGLVPVRGGTRVPSGIGQAPQPVFENVYRATDRQVVAMLAHARDSALKAATRR